MKKNFLKILLLAYFFLPACAGPNIFPSIPTNASPPVLAQPIFMAIDETRSRGYLLNSNNAVSYGNGSLMVLDLTNPTAPAVLNTITIKSFSGQAYLNTTTQLLYVANRLSDNASDTTDQILVINVDASSPTYLQVTEYETDANPFGIISDGTNLYTFNSQSVDYFLVSNLAQRTYLNLSSLQTSSGDDVNTTTIAEGTFSPSGNYIYITNRQDRLLIANRSQITAPTSAVTTGGIEGIDYAVNNATSTRGAASDSQYTYIVEGSPPSLQIFSEQAFPPVTGNPVEVALSSVAVNQIPLDQNPNEIALDTVNSRAYVTLSNENELSIIDTQLQVEITRLHLDQSLPAGVNIGQNPFGVSVGHFGGVPYIYVLNLNTNNISIINGTTQSVVSSFP